MSSHADKKMTKTRVFIVDDHPLIRLSLKDIFSRERDLAVCGEAADRKTAREAALELQPDLMIIDLKLKDSDGLALIKDIVATAPKIRCLALSMHDETLHAERVVRAGACGFVSKHEDADTFLRAVRTALAGQIYWSERAAIEVASRLSRPTRATGLPSDFLSERELQVFESVGSGTSTFEIARALHIDVSTVETYRSRIKEKLGLKSATQLLQEAIRWNLSRMAQASY
ncbi:MAG TPA: response regulator transcription factor [Verrucomicrobiae bacterium]|jgi:DNA-binding NarL/FixJ family response regulator|nr:response regulator transcription factor [Verrucomicrobiae bacterium]